MALIAFVSLAGAPGVTTSVLGLALHWPQDVLVVDIDPHPNQAVLAGYLHGSSGEGKGLSSMAQAYRDQRFSDASLVNHVLRLDTGAERACHYLPGFTHPGAPRLFEPYWAPLADDLGRLSADRFDVLFDAGRLGPGGIPEAINQAVGSIILVTRADLPSLAATRLGLSNLAEARSKVRCLVVGPGRPYTSREISDAYALPLAGDVPWAPEEAGVVSFGQAQTRPFLESSWWRSMRALASSLHSHAHPPLDRRVVVR